MRPYLLLALLPLAACTEARSEGSAAGGTTANRSYAVADFAAVKATGPDDVDVRVGAAFSIRAQGDPRELDKLEIVKNGDTLEVRRKDQDSFRWGGNESRGVKVFITMPKITAAATTGSGDMTVDRVDGDAFKASATGSGNLDIGTIKVRTVAFALTGSGDLKAAGSAGSANFAVQGSGDIDAAGLTAASADVSVMGSGSVTSVVKGPAKVDVMGSGDVNLTGGAQCTTSKMGSGDVSCS